ncbi:hypothetical protein B0T16DRAFT_411097 [Cercophora newfieldiana]|uniref:Uncharacterized protein n=1 Tax=Cercophora newfieldiana TaxID=92897 RepID=A0AA40CNE1_9PEZI|nr:hypothetical protein B0T16DRAFT_411097 [Cercophora newfieldiana]
MTPTSVHSFFFFATSQFPPFGNSILSKKTKRSEKMPVYCITGTNRGLGLEFVRQLAASPSNTILAAVRSLSSSDLGDLRAVASPTTHILECDTSSLESIHSFAKAAAHVLTPAGNLKIDYLINNAAINPASWQSSLTLNPDDMHAQIATNVLGPAKTVEFLLGFDLLSENVRILNMTSGLGSMKVSGDIAPRKSAGYSISKAALNMLAVHQAEDLKAKLPGVVVIVMDPGWVKTRMGGEGAVMEPQESIGGMLKVLEGLKSEDNGKFFHSSGDNIPW